MAFRAMDGIQESTQYGIVSARNWCFADGNEDEEKKQAM
jgi:hypothetical protein